jgi:hypothetical protein
MDCAWLRREAADGLEAAADWLQAQRPGWRILVLDALRPQRVQEAIWVDVAGTPMQEYFANPERGSIHSFGMAVDVTLLDPQGGEADMGSGFDEMTLASHPALHAEHLASGVLSTAQVAERDCLLQALQHGGFVRHPARVVALRPRRPRARAPRVAAHLLEDQAEPSHATHTPPVCRRFCGGRRHRVARRSGAGAGPAAGSGCR